MANRGKYGAEFKGEAVGSTRLEAVASGGPAVADDGIRGACERLRGEP